MAGSSQYRFGVLAKIVKHMRVRHLDGDDHPLQLDEILDETNQLDIGSSVKNVNFHKNHFKTNIQLLFPYVFFMIFMIVATNRSIAK